MIKNSLVQLLHIQIHGQSELAYEWVLGNLTGFQGSHFVCGVEGGMLVVGVCVSMWVC